MKEEINITCEGCHKTHSVPRTNEIPKDVISMGCNWCPDCEDTAEDYYQEWYNRLEGGGGSKPIPVAENQLCMPFELEAFEINENELELDVTAHPQNKPLITIRT